MSTTQQPVLTSRTRMCIHVCETLDRAVGEYLVFKLGENFVKEFIKMLLSFDVRHDLYKPGVNENNTEFTLLLLLQYIYRILMVQ